MPRAIRKAAYPKTSPLAPIVIVCGGEISQVPRPPMVVTIAVTENSRSAPLTAMIAPRVTSGSVFEIRCPKPRCRNGAVMMPNRPSGSRAMIPYWSRRPCSAVSMISLSHIKPTIATRSLIPLLIRAASTTLRLFRAGVWKLIPQRCPIRPNPGISTSVSAGCPQP